MRSTILHLELNHPSILRSFLKHNRRAEPASSAHAKLIFSSQELGMDLVAGAVGSVICKLGELLHEEYKLQEGLPEKIEFLKHELESAQTALSKVGEVPPEQLDPQVRLWASEVREASYDMEDILDTCLIDVAEHPLLKPVYNKSMGLIFNKSRRRHHIIAGAIENIKKRLQEVADHRDRFSVAVALPAPATKPDPRLADMHNARRELIAMLIGIDNARAELIAMLLPDLKKKKRKRKRDSDVSGNRKMKIVSVVGVGGLGKTTLAKAVYDELGPRYDCGAFVPIGRTPDLAQVFSNILYLLDKNEYTAILNVKDQSLLIGELRKFLQNKRYLIVIDDVWDIPTWKTIKSALVNNDTGSRVITTTRNRDVASMEEVYELRTLSPNHSEKLFKTRLFGVNGEYPANHPVEVSEKILKKCGGIPLAIITMAGLLVGKSREDWFYVCNTFGFYRGNGNQQVDDTKWILSLSYYDLPSYLKTCLLYLSVYPEDYEIEKDSLIWKWIAEGFVKKKRGTSLFQQGEEYFNQLINRSMIQADKSDYMGVVCGCRVHDMVLDLIRDLSYKENFVTVISNDDEGTSPHQNRVRRLAHQNRIMKQTQQDDHMYMAQVRSLVAYDCNIESSVLLYPSYKLLRVLDLEGCRVHLEGWQGLKHLGNLLHLRYLGLRNTSEVSVNTYYELPKEIEKLKFLQILDLEGSGVGVLPSGVCKLTQLVCLRADRFTCAPDGSFLRKVTSLEYLRIRIDNLDEESQRQFMKDVGNLSEVRVLHIIVGHLKGMVQSDLVHSLGNLHKLQHLELMDSYDAPNDVEAITELMDYMDYNGEAATREWDRVVLPRHLRHLGLGSIPFRQLPSWINPAQFPNLCYLWLRVDHIEESSLRNLGGLPELRFLLLSTARPSLMACTTTVHNITAVDGFFKKLRFCFLHGWMVQLVLNEDSTGVSFSIWNGMGTMAFGSKMKNKCSRSVAPPLVMPNLLELIFDVQVRAIYKDGNGSCGDLGLECLPSLRSVQIAVDCEGASSNDLEKAEAELRNAAQLHPNGPIIKLKQRNEYKMMAQSTDQDDKESDDGDNVFAKEEEGGASAVDGPRIILERHNEQSTEQDDKEGMTNSTQGTMEAPVSSSLGAMGSLFRKLGILLDPKYPLRSSLKHAIKLLVEDLEEIRDAHMEQLMADSHNSKAKYWMEEVRELSYDIEDSIDFLMLSHNAANEKPRSIHAPKQYRVARLKIRWLPNMLKLSTRIVRVAELRTLLWEASERHERYQLGGCISNPRSVFSGRSSRITLVYKVVADPIGIEGPKKELTMRLTNQAEQQLKVLCIFGPAGIGKTTLAKELYRELGGKFDCRAFIRVSRNPDISRLLQELLYQILRPNKQNLYACSVQGDIENIRKHLEDKRYFIVIDDLWEAEAWDIIKSAFPNASNYSRVIITCEVKNIAPECSGYHTVDTFEMKPLGSQDSENLFLDRAFSSDNQCPDPLKDVSCRMLKECGGLPLAIISAAGLFASLRDNSDIWHQLLQSVLSTLENFSLEDMLKEIVSICYNNLPQELKTCLLYLTMYPVGCTIWKDDLLKQWAAEGFITTTKGNEGVAENYFNELVKRGMIQPEKINYNNEVLSCTVHHVVLDLITYKSREENFITAVDYSRTNAMFLMKARRLSLHYSCAQYATEPEGIRVSQVRSLAFFGLPRCMPSVKEFKLLRVLILEFWGNKDDCTSINLSRICGLCLLRYLKISSQIYVELPSEIQGLKFLEILEIDARVSAVLNEKMLEINARESAVPNDIVHLPGLLHLGIRDGTKLPDRIGLITSLQTLKCFDLGYNSEDNVQSLGELINLRDLHLTCSKEVSHEHLKRKLVALASSFGRLANLKSLTLAHGAVGMTMFVDHSSAIFSTPMFLQRLELPPICTFSRLPEWIGKLRKLCVLKIVVRVLLRSDIDILTGLPGLTVLSLYVRQPNAEGVVFNSGAFPVLKYFKYRCSALCIAFREEALPNLRRLKVCFNFHRDEIYSHMISGVEHLLNLKEIAVRIGAADGGVEESDRRAVESAFERTIHKHPKFPIYMNVRRFDWVE